jgi:hypothetical protein
VELYVYSRDMTLQGIVEKISSLIWTRRYWSCGEFKLLVPFTEEHARLLVKENIIIKRGGNEAAEIRYIHITKNSQGMEEIEVQGKFLLSWIGKRILTTQIITKDTTQNILYAIVKQTCTNAGAARNIPNFSISTTDADTGSGQIDYTSEQYANAQLAAETAAKAAKLGIRVLTNARTGKHTFSVYEGRDLTAGNTAGNAPCIFSQEFDNILYPVYKREAVFLRVALRRIRDRECVLYKVFRFHNHVEFRRFFPLPLRSLHICTVLSAFARSWRYRRRTRRNRSPLR